MRDNVFLGAIVFSLALHLVFLVRFHFSKFVVDEPAKKETQVSYKIERMNANKINPSMQPAVPQLPKDAMLRDTPPPRPPKDSVIDGPAGIKDNFQIYDRKPERMKGLKVTKEVDVPVLKSEKINTPAYVAHYQIVRDRIRSRAYMNYNSSAVGKVYITFIVRADGSLGEVQILEDKTMANDFLRDASLKSVREAAPFPPFSPDLNYPELTFNIEISYQYREE